MTYEESLGFVETVGLVTAMEAADAMAKAANVKVKTVASADAALICVVCTGDLASCQAAVSAGKAAATRLGEVAGVNLIARPGDDTEVLISKYIGSILPSKSGKEERPKVKKSPAKKK